MQNRKCFSIFLLLITILPLHGQIGSPSDSLSATTKTDSVSIIKTNHIKAAGIILGTNTSVWAFDRFIMSAPYSRINLYTIIRNFKTGFVWDNDMFETNLYAHPLHGGLYFNAARYNGMNFWESVPFVAGGSLFWEFFMENEPAAINDLLSTTIGGSCLGEMTFRISDLLIDDRAVGFNRFQREALLLLISPIRGLNRLIDGEMWKHKNTRGNILPRLPLCMSSSFGYCRLTDYSQKQQSIGNTACYDLGLQYGNPHDPDNEKPYDYFTLQIGGNLFSKQTIISHINALGLLYSRNLALKKINGELLLGFFQHFNFYHAHAFIDNTDVNSYQIGEAASLGTGLLFKTKLSRHITFLSDVHVSAIFLGASQTDHYKFEKRDYNMGSGFSSKLNFELRYGNKANIQLSSGDYRIYSWIGYNTNGNGTISSNVQGDKGNASLSVVSLNVKYEISKHYLLKIESSYYYRRSVYDFYPTVKHSVTENKISVGYVF